MSAKLKFTVNVKNVYRYMKITLICCKSFTLTPYFPKDILLQQG
ncbi:hypothetical protein CLCAR_1891 [Clostridium carboxidivorans P7]|nr:hypothetical protein CLCAR_1891 [Clostridium carboxidivorans P7]